MMTKPPFAYQAFLKTKGTTEVSSLIAYWAPATAPLRAVMWSVPRRQWIYAPGTAAGLLFDEEYRDETLVIDRPTAEQMAKEQLHTELPSEETLQAMCDEGERMGWEYGPPRS